MKERDVFSGFHPANNFLFFAIMIGVTMFVSNPVWLGISFLSALCWHVRLKGRKAVRETLCGVLPLMLFTAAIMPLFNHEGMTVLAYFPSGNPLTKESIVSGLNTALLVAAVITWFFCYNAVMTTDKFVYLFGKVIPSLGLVISMTLRYVPRFRAKLTEVNEAQSAFWSEHEKKKVSEKVKNGLHVFSAMLTWSMENAVETADSMRSRGYGLPGRTAFFTYRFDGRDKVMLAWLFAGLFVIIFASANGLMYFRTYPTVKIAVQSLSAVICECLFAVFSLTPVLLSAAEDLRWRRLYAS